MRVSARISVAGVLLAMLGATLVLGACSNANAPSGEGYVKQQEEVYQNDTDANRNTMGGQPEGITNPSTTENTTGTALTGPGEGSVGSFNPANTSGDGKTQTSSHGGTQGPSGQ